MDKLIEEIIEEMKKNNKEKLDEQRDKIKESALRLLENSSCIILSTDTGMIVAGQGGELLTNVSMIINKLKEDCPEELLRSAVEIGLEDKEVTKKDKKNFLKAIKEMLDEED